MDLGEFKNICRPDSACHQMSYFTDDVILLLSYSDVHFFILSLGKLLFLILKLSFPGNVMNMRRVSTFCCFFTLDVSMAVLLIVYLLMT